ncbi:MAG: response regulator [Phycisphaerae bacterium]|nr:response regulator [Phycisphaerae bacterium]
MLGLFKTRKKVTKPKILVVDDEPDLRSTVEYRLKFSDCDVITASNGVEGLAQAEAEMPDLILLDTNMPQMDGHQMLMQLRSNPALKHIPVIMVTAISEPRDVAAASQYGISDYVTKPFNFSELMEKVQTALNIGEDN